MPKTERARHLLAKLVLAGSLAALPAGLLAVPAAAYPTPVGPRWSYECDHTGPWQWQQNRGNWEWNNCDFNRGYWIWVRDHDRPYWQWHYRNDWDRW